MNKPRDKMFYMEIVEGEVGPILKMAFQDKRLKERFVVYQFTYTNVGTVIDNFRDLANVIEKEVKHE